MRGSPILTKTLNELKAGTRTVVHQGGQWSGKTVNILGALSTLCSEEDCEPYTTTVTATSVPHLKGGALSDFEMYVYPSFKDAIEKYHRTDRIFTFRSGHKLEFKSFENEQAARGAKRKRLFINEANAIDRMIYFQLHSRSEQTIIDYNPSVSFWAHEELIGQPGVKTIYSDHRHNPFLTKQKHAEIEALYDFKTKRGDLELWKVYARGLTGNVTGVIFPNWGMIEDEQFPNDDECIFAIDFGYTIDPTVIVKLRLIGETLFVKELSYEPGLPPHRMRQILEANGWDSEKPVYCDGSDPEMIRELRMAGVTYANQARAGRGSINAGIELLNTFHVKYTHSSRNLHKDRSRYIWEKDKATGKNLNIPIDKFNHCFDAIRYGVYSKWLRHELKRA